jgi:membrane-bound lytic murein transglycosylase F
MIPREDAAFMRNLVEKYADDINVEITVVPGDWPLDSLASGAVDLMIVPEETIDIPDNIAFSRAFADGTVWAVRASETEALRHINRWITELTASERFNRMQRRYLSGKPVNLTSISQYDNLIRAAADSIGWDWRLLAAVVYHESRFHNDATSHKGARGLMQIRSSRYTAEELANPARNISVGARYLHRLEGMFPGATPMESIKFALAAYNMGEGKVARLISQAEAQGMDASRWSNVAKLLPQGHHTVSYVNNVLDTYQYYSRVYR